MNSLKRELNLLLLALGFLSRIPVPMQLDYNAQTLNASSRYFTVIGVLIGACMAAIYAAASQVFPASVAVLMMLIGNLLLTGCFHQDGLADMADGFGGAFEPRRKLEIMKDSRLGTYGSCALVMALAAHYITLVELEAVLMSVVVGQSLSRCLAASIIYNTAYAADPDASKAKPLSQAMSGTDLCVLLVSAALVLALLPLHMALSLVPVLLVFRFLFKRYIIAQIGGYTGDCLGASQQLSEILIYLTLLAWQGAIH